MLGLFIAVTLTCLAWLAEGQESLVYIGTGVNGSLQRQNNNDVLVLGGLFPVHKNRDSKCGSILDLGVQRLEAMVLATEKINKDSAFLRGVDLAFEIRDTCVLQNEALEQSLRYVTDRTLEISSHNGTVLGISGVVGAASSSVSIDVANLLRLFDIPQISYASTAKILSDKSRFEYFFRTVPPDSLQARTMADIVEHFNWTYVIAMHSADTYGTEGIRAFKNELRMKNSTQMCVAVTIEVKENNYDSAIEAMNRNWIRNATVVVLFGQLTTAVGVLEAVGRKRKTDPAFAAKNITWIGSDAWGDQIPERLYETAKGSLSVIPESFMSSEFDTYFQSLHPHNYTANPWFIQYWESVFNCTLRNKTEYENCDLVNQAISPANGYRQNSKVTFTLDAVYAFAHAIHNMQQNLCPDGRGLCDAIVDTRNSGTAIRGELLLKYLHNVSFSGMSTEVIRFDNNGDQQGGYIVKNLQKTSNGRFVFENIGRWNEGSLDRDGPLNISGEIQWSHGQGDDMVPQSLCSYPCGSGEYPIPIADQAECCWVCKPCPGENTVSVGLECSKCERGYTPNKMRTKCMLIEPTYLHWSDAWSIIVLIIACFGIVATSTVAIILIVYHKHRIVKASSRELIAVLLTGIMLCYLLPFFFIAMPSPTICAIRRFGVGFCFSLCYSALLVKTNRIHRIFNRPPGSTTAPPLINPQSQLFFTALLVTVQIVIAVVWLVVEIPSTEYVYYTKSTELKCGESPHIGLSITLGYNLLLLLATLYFTFRTRKVPQNFNEAKFISFTIYTLCILWLAFIPTYYSTANIGTVYQTGSQVLGILLNAFVTLFILFVPKIYFLFSRIRSDSMGGSSHINSTIQHSIKEKPRLGSIDAQTSSLRLLSLTSSLKIKPEGPNTSGLVTAVAETEDKECNPKKADPSTTMTTLSSSGSISRVHTEAINQLQLVDATTQTIE